MSDPTPRQARGIAIGMLVFLLLLVWFFTYFEIPAGF